MAPAPGCRNLPLPRGARLKAPFTGNFRLAMLTGINRKPHLTSGEIKANMSSSKHLAFRARKRSPRAMRARAARASMSTATILAGGRLRGSLGSGDRAKVSELLQCYWGYQTFRPGQEAVVSSLLAGRDACVVMPTGGGKSLCYQLPAVLDAGRSAVVVSPLIALMQDQVAQLRQMGISAAFVHSSLSGEERSQILKRAAAGDYRLLYFSPERVALGDTPEWLKRIPVSFFAIDEAHCISEWGHEFRPEYRQLSRLR